MDSLDLSAICVVTIRKVLSDGFPRIKMVSLISFVIMPPYPSIFSLGFCDINIIEHFALKGIQKFLLDVLILS